jgi:4-amino-4-deoxy-L-arabinose transferase-like glycosyltransferase
VVTVAFFTVTTTKFHHYIFPLCVPAALLIGRFLDELSTDDAPRVSPALALFIALMTALVARDLVLEPWQFVDLFTYHYKGYKPDYYFPSDAEWRVGLSIAGFGVAVLIAAGGLLDALRARPPFEPAEAERTGIIGARIADLWPRHDPTVHIWRNSTPNRMLVLTTVVSCILFAVFAVQVHFNRASQHWTQRHIWNTYHALAKPDEPFIAYQMDWKGETFYGRNNDIQVKKSGADLKKLIDRPGKAFVIVHTDRFGSMKTALGKDYERKIRVVDRSNVKWYLVEVDD